MTEEILPQICVIKGCEDLVHGCSMCAKHLTRFRKHGDPMKGGRYKIVRSKGYTLEARFWPKVDKDGPIQPNMTTPCWIWIAGPSKRYGLFGFQGHSDSAHRWSYRMAHDMIELTAEDYVCHECDNPRCVNPDHLFLGNALINNRDKIVKGRANIHTWRLEHPEWQPRGERINTAVLNEDQIIELQQRFDAGDDTKLLAEEYGVSRTQIYRLGNRSQWQHLGIEEANRPKHPRYAPKLNEDKVREIRTRAENGEDAYDLAKEFDVHVTTVQGVISRKRYKNIE